MPATYDPNCAIEDQASDSILRTVALYKAAGWSQRNLVDVIDNFWASTPQATPEAVPETEGDNKPTYEQLVAEMHLLEEVCAFYANDEDRFLKSGGEPFGSIPTEVGLKARGARQRFNERENNDNTVFCPSCMKEHPLKLEERKSLAILGEHSVVVTEVRRVCETTGQHYTSTKDHDWRLEARHKLNEKLGNNPNTRLPGVTLQEIDLAT